MIKYDNHQCQIKNILYKVLKICYITHSPDVLIPIPDYIFQTDKHQFQLYIAD